MKNKEYYVVAIIALFGIFFSSNLCAQKYFTKDGFTFFKASVESFEAIEAESESATAILDLENGAFAALIFIRSFNFEIALMEEHFNENYIESDLFPKASFKGKVNPDILKTLTDSFIESTIKGTMSIHGVEKEIEMLVLLKKVGEEIEVQANFYLFPQDFDIEIPSVVSNKIAKKIDVEIKLVLKKKG